MNILDPKFRYVPASKTDIRRTFARVRAQMKEQQAKVMPLKRVAK
jgi:hypothetical protein